MSASDDIVLTGTGVVTALGFGVKANHAALAAGTSAVAGSADGRLARAARIEPPYFRTEAPDELDSQIKFLNASGELAVCAAREALDAAGGIASFADVPSGRRSLYLAQVDCADWDCREIQAGVTAGLAAGTNAEGAPDPVRLNKSANRKTKPFFLLEGLKNNAFSFIATWFETRGPNTAVGGYDLSGLHALERAVQALSTGRTDMALVVGAAFTTDPVVRREVLLLDLAARVPGDGAGAIVLERRADAERRGATILATWLGAAARSGFTDVDEATRSALEAAAQGLEIDTVIAPEAQADELGGTSLEPRVGYLSAASEPARIALALGRIDGVVAIVSVGLAGQVGALVLKTNR